ncbi:hypothetical protein KBB06_03380, partial [Candidatus Gracilibacteria bacterium]|nr:hypothetical protein [Candidatus Gracilibacteria bacterium]
LLLLGCLDVWILLRLPWEKSVFYLDRRNLANRRDCWWQPLFICSTPFFRPRAVEIINQKSDRVKNSDNNNYFTP